MHIDHHISNVPGCGDVNLVVPDASSTAEVLYGLIPKEDMDTEIATAIYTGIIHDTGVFQYTNTSPKTMQIGAELIGYGFPFAQIIEESFYQKTYLQTQVLGRALIESIRFMDGQCIFSCMDQEKWHFTEQDPPTWTALSISSGTLPACTVQFLSTKRIHGIQGQHAFR